MSRWKEYNPNPKNARVGDCTIRAICKAVSECERWMIMKELYSFWVWLKELFGFGNLGTIHVIDLKCEKKEENDE